MNDRPEPPLRKRLERLVQALYRIQDGWTQPVVDRLSEEREDPFVVLVSCVLSLRTRDEVTDAATRRLLNIACTPHELAEADPHAIEQAIYPVAFYRVKTKQLQAMSDIIVRRHRGVVPKALDTLLALPGVGRKTANLVRTLGHGLPGICVDTHVHRISNRWGIVSTRTPEETEVALRAILPRRYWIDINGLLVGFGQTICQPVSPWCSRCPLRPECRRNKVVRSR